MRKRLIALVGPSPDLNYRQVRLRWCYARLMNFLRRWNVYLLVGVLALGSSSIGDSSISSMTAVPAATLLPIFWSLQQPLWVAALVAAGYCAFGVIACYGLRPLLWSIEWCEVENALPISSKEQWLSDFIVLVIGLTPLLTIYAVGMTHWLINTSVSGSELLKAMAMLLLSLVTSVIAGMGMLQSMRRRGSRSNAQTIPKPPKKTQQKKSATTSVFVSLIVLPLKRGPAKRAGYLLLFVPLIAVTSTAPIWWPALTPWWLAIYSCLILLLTTRLNIVLQFDLVPLHLACAPLPVPARRLRLWRSMVAMIPITVTLPILITTLFGMASQLRSFVAVCFVAAALFGNLFQILGMRVALGGEKKATTQISVWLGILLLQIALASEIMK